MKKIIITKRIKNLTKKEKQENAYLLDDYKKRPYENLFFIINSVNSNNLKIDKILKFKQFYILFNIDKYEYIELFKGFYLEKDDLFFITEEEFEKYI